MSLERTTLTLEKHEKVIQTMEERKMQEKCIYCAVDEMGDSISEDIFVDKGQELFCTKFPVFVAVSNDRLEVTIGSIYGISKKINYCPMCGRKLQEVKA